MKETQQNDVIRCTLQSFVGKSIKNLEMTDRQKAVVERVSRLRDAKFYELCNDIINDIKRRTGLKYDKDNKMCCMFTQLSEPKFKNLVIEALAAFYLKNPDCKMEEMPEFLNSVKSLIEQLKKDSEKTLFVSKLEKLEFYNKIHELVGYLRRKEIDGRILAHIEASLEKKMENESVNFVESLSFPRIFLEKLAESEIYKSVLSEELEKHRNNILATLGDTSVDILERSRQVKLDLVEIFQILINNSNIPAKRIECFETEISDMVEILTAIKTELEGDGQVDFHEVSRTLDGILQSIHEKGRGCVSDALMNEIHLVRISLESLGDGVEDRNDNLKSVIDVVEDIRKILGKIEL